MSAVRIVIAGAAGRMGRTLARAVLEDGQCLLVGALEAPGHPELGTNAAARAGGGAARVMISDDAHAALAQADAVIDFTIPAVSVALAALTAKLRKPHVIGTTGFSPDDEEKIRALACQTAIVKSGNMSRGVTLLASLAKHTAKALPDFDVEIVEMHHRMKADAPSGTALLLGRAAAQARGMALEAEAARSGETGARKDGAIGFASVRGGTVVGEHQVIFAGPHERVILSHVAEDRSIFALGALAAAKWAQGRAPGLYTMADVLGVH
jgi:4-hydroxy-tetrahydrodipicolinate reductase